MEYLKIRRRLRFELVKATLIAVRGYRGRYQLSAVKEQDLNLTERQVTTMYEIEGDDDERGLMTMFM